MKNQHFEEAFARVNLDRLAEAELKDISQLRGLKALYEAAYPETRQGANGGRGGKKEKNVTLTFSKKLSEHDGISLRSAERLIKIADGISKAVERRIYSSGRLIELVARRRMELLALADHDDETQGRLLDVDETQRRILDVIEAGKAATVAEAEQKLKLVPAGPPKWERQVVTGWRQFTGFEAKAQKEILRRAIIAGKANDILAEMGLPPIEGEAEEPFKVDPVELEGYLSASELVEAKLKGLPRAKKNMIELARRSNWRFVDVLKRGGKTRLYAIEDLPGNARREYLRQRAVGFAQLGRTDLKARGLDRRSEIVISADDEVAADA